MKNFNTDNPLLSVIIPMYNCAPVITRCLDSIDYPGAEIIVVNDGSIDNGAEVVHQYAISHPNVRLIDKPNGGASSARNLGIAEAKGKYIAFIDADDFWFPNGIARIVELAERAEADVVKYIIRHVEKGQPLPQMDLANYAIHEEIMEGRGKALERCDISDYHVVDAVFKRSVIIDNNIRFRTDLHLHEDDCFMGMFYCHAEKIVITDLPLYCYIRSSTYSSTHRQSIERQKILINSGYLAVQYRSEYVQAHYPKAMSMERLKYMRYVVTPKVALNAQMTLKEYKELLSKYSEWKVYPLRYQWIEIAHWYASPMVKLKYILKTFLINHPCLGFLLYQFCMNK